MPPDDINSAAPDFIPDEAALPQAASTEAQPAFIPDDQFVPDDEKYSGLGQQLKTAAEGAAETATLGLSSAIEKGAGVKPEDILGRAKANPIAHGIGEVAGAVAPALFGDEAGAVNFLGKAGKLGETAGKALVDAAPESLATKIAGWAGRGAAEGALMSGEHVLNERILGDPEATAEHAWAEVGLSALAGGAGGAILGRVGEAAEGLAKEYGATAKKLASGFVKLKDNADEIAEVAARNGLAPLDGQLAGSRQAQDLYSQITKEPTIVGRQEQARVEQHFDKIRDLTTEALDGAAPVTKVEAGESLREGLKSKLEETYRPISEAYDFLKTELNEVPLDEKSLLGVTRSIRNIDGVRVSPSSPEYRLAENVAEEVRQLSNVTELRQYASSVARQTAGDPALKYVGGAIRNILNDAEEDAIVSSYRNLVKQGAIPKEELDVLMHTRTAAKAQYKELLSHMGEIGDVIGKKRIYGPRDFLDHLADVPAEKLADKLFQKNNSKFLGFLQEHFPQQAKTLGDYQRSLIAEKAFKDGVVQPGVVKREIDKLQPEVQKFLFSKEALQKLDDAKVLLDAMPKDVNPSGTAKSLTWGEALNPLGHAKEAIGGGLLGGPAGAVAGYALGVAGPEVSTLIKKSLLRGLVSGRPEEVLRHETIGRLLDISQRTVKAVSSAAKAALSAKAGERLALSRDEGARASEKFSALAKDPQKLVDRLGKLTDRLADHAPETSTAMSGTAGRAVTFLASKVPKPVQMSPFAPPVEPSDFQKAQFKRYAEAVLDPVGVLSRVSDGSISTSDVEALQAVYPKLYASMRQSVVGAMADAVHKQTEVPYRARLGASLFLGSAIDRSLSPDSVSSVQATFAVGDGKPDPEGGAAMKPRHSTAPLSKVGAEYATPEQAAAARRSSPR